MTPTQIAKLERIKNRHTRYEIVGTNGATRLLAGYTARRSRRGLLEMVRTNGERWVDLAGTQSFAIEGGVYGPRAVDNHLFGAHSARGDHGRRAALVRRHPPSERGTGDGVWVPWRITRIR